MLISIKFNYVKDDNDNDNSEKQRSRREHSVSHNR